MLNNVHIKNLALIKEAEIDFRPGLNVLTGETGAGKSIIISAVNIALGDKASKSMIRNDAESGLIELSFGNVSTGTLNILAENDIDQEDGDVLITRRMTRESSISRVNGQNVTLSTLKNITAQLVDIHGQHDHQSLLDEGRHIDIVDSFGGKEIEDIKKELLKEFSDYRALRTEYKQYGKTEEEVEAETELIRFELKEIEDAALKEGEDVQLENEYKKISAVRDVTELLRGVYRDFSADGDSVPERISVGLKLLNDAVLLDESAKPLRDAMADLESVAKDLGRDIEHYISRNTFDGERLNEIRARLDEINHLKSKYGNSLEQIQDYQTDISEKISYYDQYFIRKTELEKLIHDSGLRLNEISGMLSAARHSAAEALEEAVAENLKDLNFNDTRFSVSSERLERITDNGFDKITFMISANPGEPLMPLARIASGGELSRIMLAVKSALAQKDGIATLIFDEIDTGISGKTAQLVAQKLYDLSKTHQVICISHLPQIAAMADTHYHIHKEVEDGSTISGIARLNDEQMIYEIAKMLGGETVTPAALENARDLKGNANFFKRKLK